VKVSLSYLRSVTIFSMSDSAEILHKLMSGASRFPDEIGVFVTYQFVALTVASKSGWTRLGLSANENERSSSLHNGYSEGSVFLFGAPPLSRRLGFGSAS
jgi:hypothetical protein